MRNWILLLLSLFLISCSSSSEKNGVKYVPKGSFSPQESPLDRKLSGGSSREVPVSSPVDPKFLDTCTRLLLFTNQYISVSDYPEAEQSLEEASKYCGSNDPRFNYMKAVLLDIKGEKEEAYKYYYKAAKEYIKVNNMEGAFECFSGMVSIDPNREETKEIKRYFLDDDY